MAIKHKRTTTTGYNWQAADLADGQIGLNTTDGSLHFKRADNTIVKIDDLGLDIYSQSTAPTDTSALWIDTSDPTGSALTLPSNYVLVKSADDLPAAVSGQRQLADNTLYQFNGTVTLSDTLVLGTNTMLMGLHLGNDILLYTGTGAAITGTNKSFFTEKLIIVAPLGSAVDISGTGTTEFFCFLTGFNSCASVGTISGFKVPTFINCVFDNNTTGLTFTGTTNKIFFSGTPFRGGSASGTSLNFDSNFSCEIIDIQGCYFKTSNAAHTAINFHSTATLTGYALFQSNSFIGMTTPIIGFGPETNNFSFVNNYPFRDSRKVGSISLQDNTTATTLTQNTWTKVAGTTTTGVLERFSHPQSNRLTYIDTRNDAQGVVIATLSVLGTTNNQVIEAALYRNGTIASPVMKALLAGTTRAESLALNAIVDFNTDDYVEVWIRCTSGNNDVTVEHMQFTVNAS